MSNTPFRRHKTWVHEGGISTPLIAHWPKGISGHGELRAVPGHVIDVVPTILELSGVSRKDVVAVPGPESPGRSLVPHFANGAAESDRSIWWLHEGNRALRRGHWKIVAAKGQPWELYDLSTDRAEQKNLADSAKDRLADLEKEWQQITDEFTALAKQSE